MPSPTSDPPNCHPSPGEPTGEGAGSGAGACSLRLNSPRSACKGDSSHPKPNKDSPRERGVQRPPHREKKKSEEPLEKILNIFKKILSTCQTVNLNKLHSCRHKDQDLQIKGCFCKRNPKTSNLLKKRNQNILFPQAARPELKALAEERVLWAESHLLGQQGEEEMLPHPISPHPSLLVLQLPAWCSPAGIRS